MVRLGIFMGIILFEIMKQAKMLPTSSRLMEFMSCRLFSLIIMYGGNQDCPRRAKKMIHLLYTAVREVAISIIERARALVYDMLADLMMRSLE
jgi:hypothetical protein